MKACGIGSTRNESTNRCRKDCATGKKRNTSGRCVKNLNTVPITQVKDDKTMSPSPPIVDVNHPILTQKVRIEKVSLIPPFIDVMAKPIKIRKIEEKRLIREKKAEDKRIIREKKAEDKRIIREKKAEDKAAKKAIRDAKPKVKRNVKPMNTEALKKKEEIEAIKKRLRRERPPPPPPLVRRIPDMILTDNTMSEHMSGCNITTNQVHALSYILGIKYTEKYNTCRFISKVLGLPKGSILTGFVARGSTGIILSIDTPSGKSHVAKLLRLLTPHEDIKKQVGEVQMDASELFPGYIWMASTQSQMDREIDNHNYILEKIKSEDIFKGLSGIIVPKIHSNHTVKLPGGDFGVIMMDNLKGGTLWDMMDDDSIPFETTKTAYMKFATVIIRFLTHGISHGDPHPHNVVVLEGTSDIAIIDFGRSFFFLRPGMPTIGRERHILESQGGNYHRCTYDMQQVMLPFYINPDGLSKFVKKMGRYDTFVQYRRLIFENRAIYIDVDKQSIGGDFSTIYPMYSSLSLEQRDTHFKLLGSYPVSDREREEKTTGLITVYEHDTDAMKGLGLEWKLKIMLDYEKKDFESSYSHSREGDNVDELDMQFDKKIGALKRENDIREFNRGRQ